MIFALAGRRIDAPDAEEKRFPLDMQEIVYDRIRDLFHKHNVRILVSSAACGADLLAHKAAQELGIEQHIILPFEREKFRRTSVTDRPGNWGKLFDEICDEAEREGNVIVLEDRQDDAAAYRAVTDKILEFAEDLQKENEIITAVIVWDGKAKNEDDETVAFAKKAQQRNMRVEEILTGAI